MANDHGVQRSPTVRASPRLVLVLFSVALFGTICQFANAFAQEIRLVIPADDLVKNTEPVQSIAFSPDGRLVATAHGTPLGMLQKPRPGQTILWDSQTGKRVRTIAALNDGVRQLAFSPDGKILAMLEATGTIRLMSVPDAGELRQFRANDKSPAYYSLAFFPDGRQLAVGLAANPGNPKNQIVILDVASGKQLRTLVGHLGMVSALAVAGDGKLLASGAWDGTARIWNALTGQTIANVTFPSLRKKAEKEFEADKGGKALTDEEREQAASLIWVKAVAFSPDGKTLAAVAEAQLFQPSAVELWDIAARKSKATLSRVGTEVRQLAFSPDGKALITAGVKVKVWDTTTFKESGTIKGLWPIALSPDANTLATTIDERAVMIQQRPAAIR